MILSKKSARLLAAERAANAHTDLNTFASVVSLLEGGHIYLPASRRAVGKIITICKREQSKRLAAYDAAINIVGKKD